MYLSGNKPHHLICMHCQLNDIPGYGFDHKWHNLRTTIQTLPMINNSVHKLLLLRQANC